MESIAITITATVARMEWIPLEVAVELRLPRRSIKCLERECFTIRVTYRAHRPQWPLAPQPSLTTVGVPPVDTFTRTLPPRWIVPAE